MFARTKRLAAATALSGSLLFGLAPAAGATHTDVHQDGLVNVAVGDINVLTDADIAVAANLAVTLCDIEVGPLAIAVLGQAVAVDRSGRERTICETDTGDVTITQN